MSDKQVFPGSETQRSYDGRSSQTLVSSGLTLRELYAGLAMQGYNANPGWDSQTSKDKADWAVLDADALIAALEEKP